MSESYIARSQKLSERLSDTALAGYAKGKFLYENIKQGYLQLQKRLNPEVFTYLNDEYLTDFYNFSEPKLWNGYLLLTIDESKEEMPNFSENRELCGKSTNQHSDLGQVRALMSGMYDILNRFYLDIEIALISASEIELAKDNLEDLKCINIKQPVLAIFDRGYLSIEFKDYKKRRKHPEVFEHMKEKGCTNTRIMISNLPSGKELAIMANLPYQFSQEQLQDLYDQRWEIEKKYHTLKNKMKFESITRKSTIYVDQDFRAQVLVYNMMQDIRKVTDEKIHKKSSKTGRKYPMHTNEKKDASYFWNCKQKWKNIFCLKENYRTKNEKRIFQINIKIIRRIAFKKSMPFQIGKVWTFLIDRYDDSFSAPEK